MQIMSLSADDVDAVVVDDGCDDHDTMITVQMFRKINLDLKKGHVFAASYSHSTLKLLALDDKKYYVFFMFFLNNLHESCV